MVILDWSHAMGYTRCSFGAQCASAQQGGVSLVHNGIIENYADLKAVLAKEGAVFESETDTELIAHLIEKELKTSKDLLLAVQKVVPQLVGRMPSLSFGKISQTRWWHSNMDLL